MFRNSSNSATKNEEARRGYTQNERDDEGASAGEIGRMMAGLSVVRKTGSSAKMEDCAGAQIDK